MLYLSRREGQAVVIDGSVEVRVVEVRGRTVKLGVTFPPGVSVLREEVVLAVRRENEAAAAAAEALAAELAEPGDEGEARP